MDQAVYNSDDDGSTNELAIVDLFTRLIFGEGVVLSDVELTILQALRLCDENISMESSEEIGVYLRALGVNEMIQLVSRVKNQIDEGGLRVAADAPRASIANA